MEAIIEVLLQFIFEILLQIIVEVLCEIGLRAVADVIDAKPRHPIVTLLGYTLIGASLGGLTLLPFPHQLIRNRLVRLANLVVTPLLAGTVMALIGAWRERRGQRLIQLDRFVFGFAFAFAMTMIRFIFAK